MPALGRGLFGDSNINFVPVTEIKAPTDREPAPPGFVFEGKSSDFLAKMALLPTIWCQLHKRRSTEYRKLYQKRQMLPEVKRTMQEAQVAMNKVGNAAESADNILRSNQERIGKALDNVTMVSERLSNLFTPAFTQRSIRSC